MRRWLISIALFAEVDNFKKNGKEDMNDKIRRRIKGGGAKVEGGITMKTRKSAPRYE
jgi:hypothetical protein